MHINETIEVEILSNGMDGEGVARLDGMVVFIPYTLKGERVRAVVKQVKKKYAVASVIKVLQPSPDRIAPECPHYYKCGGCDMGHVSAEFRRAALVGELKNNLKKIVGIDVSDVDFVPTVGGKYGRNKLSMPFGIADGKVVLGLYRQNTHIVEPARCLAASATMLEIADMVCEFANEKRLSVYSQNDDTGLLRHLVIREVGGKSAATLVVNTDKATKWEKELAERMPSGVDFFVCPNIKKNNVIMGESVRLVKGNARLEVNVLGVKAELSPLSFFQVNDYIRDRLYEAALDEIVSDKLIDLYSGIGITSNLAARRGVSVVAVECVPQAVKDAEKTAAINGNKDKIVNLCGRAEKLIAEIAKDNKGADILVDPPRKGCGAAVMRAAATVEPQRLIYISCNHATMCADIAVFLGSAPNYYIKTCKLFDMFPETHHTETLCILARNPA